MQNSEGSPESAVTNSSTTPEFPYGNVPLQGVNNRLDPLVKWMMYIAAAVLFLYVCFMFTDVVLRYVFNSPLPLGVDITQLALVLLCFFSIGYAQLMKSHIHVDLLTSRLKPKPALALSTAMYIICVVIAGIMTWQGVLNAISFYNTGTTTYGGLALFPAAVLMPIGAFVLCVIFLRDIISKLIEGRQLGLGAISTFLSLVLPVAFMVLVGFLIFQVYTPLSTFAVGALGILLLFFLIFLGMPVAFALITVAIIVMGYAGGPTPGFMSVGPTLFHHVSSYTWIVIPLYILMSYFILVGGLGTAAFWGVYRWIGHIRGGLATAVVGGSTALAAVVGTGTAATVTMGLIALPEMRKYKYSDALATGSIAAGATLGPIIPPSLPFIVYGILTETSIGALFIAGIIPGLMLAASFVAVILIGVRIIPTLGPAAGKSTWGERIKSIPVFGPILLLFLIIIGGIYAGVFTVMEGGAWTRPEPRTKQAEANTGIFGKRELRRLFWIYRKGALVKKSVEFWRNRMAYIWRMVRVSGFLPLLSAEPWDVVAVNLQDIFPNVTNGWVQEVQHSTSPYGVAMLVWLPILPGTKIEDDSIPYVDDTGDSKPASPANKVKEGSRELAKITPYDFALTAEPMAQAVMAKIVKKINDNEYAIELYPRGLIYAPSGTGYMRVVNPPVGGCTVGSYSTAWRTPAGFYVSDVFAQ